MLNIYRASAGSGKTYQLTLEYIKLLLGYRKENDNGTTELSLYDKYKDAHRRILAVTFTNKATEEMKRRIISQLSILAHHTNQSEYLDELINIFHCDEEKIRFCAQETLYTLLHDFSFFNISTIDTFFQQTLRTFTREVGLQGGFDIELDNNYVTSAAIDKMFSELDEEEHKELLQWLLKYSEEKVEGGKSWNIYGKDSDKGDIKELARELTKENYKLFREYILSVTADKSLFRNYLKELKKIRLDFEKRLQDIGTIAIGIISDAGLKTSDFKNGATSGCNFFNKMAEKKWNKNIVEPPKARFTSLEDEENNWFVKTSPHRAAILSIYPSLNPLVKETLLLFNTEYKTYMTAVETSKYLYALGILIDIDKRIEDYEKEHNILLLSDTSEILNSIINENDTPFIYEKTGTQIDHFMIDEFQDTSRLQWKNFAPLIHESQSHNRDNMIVGDVKQSIYRWRNSDWKLLNNELSQEFSPSQRVDKVMDTNWRSCANIIRFNNAFFYNAAFRLQNNLTEIIDPKEKNFPAITDAYADIYQNIPSKKRNNEGYVELKMLADSSENSYQENVLQRIPDILKELQDRGRKLKDIAFLVRTGNQGKQIVDLLLDLNAKNTDDKYRFDVISNESLLLKNAPVIKLITGILQYLQNPDNELNCILAFFEYEISRKKSTAETAIKNYFRRKEHKEPVFDKEVSDRLIVISQEPLFEMCEQIIELFTKNSLKSEENVYIQAFQDMILEYTSSHPADLYSFLQWWNHTGSSRAISTPESQDAIQVITIHKSKGLEFKTVIIPFCDWSIDHDTNKTNLIWCRTHEAPFNELPVVPLKYGNNLSLTQYAEDYYLEKLHAYIDNLNLAYVAFTRAQEELFIFSPFPAPKSTTINIGHLLYECIFSGNTNCRSQATQAQITLKDYITEQEDDVITLTLGEKISLAPHPAEKQIKENKLPEYLTILPGKRLHLRLQGKSLFQGQNIREYGTLMHELLSSIHSHEDIGEVVDRYTLSGILSKEQAINVKKQIFQWISSPEVSEWFDPRKEILTETGILQKEGSFYRPDRVIIGNDKVTVIDYKFGQSENSKYMKQIRNYIDLIKKIGYPQVEGIIWYPESGKLIRT